MTRISLSDYRAQIEASIAQDRYEEAVAHSRHILEQYPKYVRAYWLLGKTILEAGQAERASDMFQRVLSADPEHLLAWVGMSEIAEQRRDLGAAVWYLERAFELATDNEMVAEELRRLYGDLEGREPERLQLTQGALARLYLRGDLLSRAITELRKLLDEHPGRVDLRVALAEALWRSGQRLQAAEVCQEILEEQPYNLKANLILGEIWTNSGREEGEFYLERAEEIDPENEVAQELFGSSSPLPPEEPQITLLEYEAAEEGPAWMVPMEELGPAEAGALARPEDLATSKIEIPQWLQELAGEAAPETLAPVKPTEEEVLEEFPAEPAEEAFEEDFPAEPAEEEFEEPVAAEEVGPEKMPGEEDLEWLHELEEGEVEARELEDEAVAFEEEIPAWLTDLGIEPEEQEAVFEAEEPESAREAEEPEPGEIPDWLREMAPAEEERSQVPPPDALAALLEGEPSAGEEPEEDLLAWLEEEDIAFDDEALDWLEELSEAEEEELLAQAEGESEARLAEILGRPEEAAPEKVSEELEEEAQPALEAEEMGAPEPFEPEEEMPAWLEGEEMPSGDEALEWLEQLSEGKEEELLAQAEAESEARLAEILGKPEEVEPQRIEEEQEEAAVEPEVEEPTLQAEEAAPEEFELEGELPAWLEGEEMPSGDEALAWLEQLSEGKEEELLAQAEAESEARLAEIMGRPKLAPEEIGPEKVKEEPEEAVEEPTLEAEEEPEELELEEPTPEAEEAAPEEVEPEEEAFGWTAFAESVPTEEAEPVEEPPSVEAMEVPEQIAPVDEAEALPQEEAFGWTAFAEEVVPEREEVAPEEEIPVQPEEPAAAEVPAEPPAEPVAEAPAEAPAEAAEPTIEEEAVAEVEVPEVVEEEPSVEEPEPVSVEEAEPEAVEEAPEPEAIEAEEKVARPAVFEEAPIEDLGQFIAKQRAYAEEHPADDEAWLELGRVLWQTDQREEAIETYDRLVSRDAQLDEIIPDLEDYAEQWSDPCAMQALGDAYMRTDRLQDALDVYRRALESL
jgi:Flp pilus assembly protein TadD